MGHAMWGWLIFFFPIERVDDAAIEVFTVIVVSLLFFFVSTLLNHVCNNCMCVGLCWLCGKDILGKLLPCNVKACSVIMVT